MRVSVVVLPSFPSSVHVDICLDPAGDPDFAFISVGLQSICVRTVSLLVRSCSPVMVAALRSMPSANEGCTTVCHPWIWKRDGRTGFSHDVFQKTPNSACDNLYLWQMSTVVWKKAHIWVSSSMSFCLQLKVVQIFAIFSLLVKYSRAFSEKAVLDKVFYWPVFVRFFSTWQAFFCHNVPFPTL